ncbi:hypothetical protein J5751_00470 [bacterium]|nr:hypothetical protein [bacterium]
MNKHDIIIYLNCIKPFLNLKAICEDYNLKNPNTIDYNNLRAVLNGVSETRLSEERLNSFMTYIYHDLFAKTFDVYNLKRKNNSTQIKKIVDYYVEEMSNKIIKEIHNEI